MEKVCGFHDMPWRKRSSPNALSCKDSPGIAASIHACSACAGDYENPERTARRPGGDADEEDDQLLTRGSADDADSTKCDEIPAEEM